MGSKRTSVVDRLRDMPPADSHRSCNGTERQPLFVESNRFDSLFRAQSRRSSDHTASSQMSRDSRTMNPIRLGKTRDAGPALVVLDQLRHLRGREKGLRSTNAANHLTSIVPNQGHIGTLRGAIHTALPPCDKGFQAWGKV